MRRSGRCFVRAATALSAAAFILGGLFFAAPDPAFAQYRNYSGYQAYPAYPPYAYPAYPDVFPEDLPPAYRGYPYSYAAPNPYESGAGRPVRRASREPYGDGDQELRVDPSQRTAALVRNPTSEAPGTIVIDTRSRHLYLVQPGGEAIQYGIGVGRQGFEWRGVARVGRKAEWPRWIPPKEMLQRRPDLPDQMEGGLENPLGARALYLYQGNRDTMFRIHGTNEPDSIGKAVSSGCIRMMNADVIDLYQRVGVGARVVVL
ncbi:L,D-transpeptidase catalytic domain [Methylocapsa palsarum]|uniref:L,D-transpeptidase catalytic domain n=2 Tax=Methylocapsa palsarum TaxID=1612308 RepID=A0A1I4AIE0_9HYPH|nr:L,D-transpeptidase catalytic domain [Methylocapsa palsarum]